MVLIRKVKRPAKKYRPSGGGGYGGVLYQMELEIDLDHIEVFADGPSFKRDLDAVCQKLGPTWRVGNYTYSQTARNSPVYHEGTSFCVPPPMSVTANVMLQTMDMNVNMNKLVDMLRPYGMTVLKANTAALAPPRPPTGFIHKPDEWAYEATEVQCQSCKAKFMHTELIDTTKHSNPEDEYVSECVCPKCGAPDCCEVEYEK